MLRRYGMHAIVLAGKSHDYSQAILDHEDMRRVSMLGFWAASDCAKSAVDPLAKHS